MKRKRTKQTVDGWQKLWAELHRPPPPGISHPIPRLKPPPVPPRVASSLEKLNALLRSRGLGLCVATGLASALLCGCQVLSYTASSGERFTRTNLGATTSLSSLVFESGSNGLRRVELRGYRNDSAQSLGVVTDAAIRAAIQSAK